jgi:hypothetical protein
MTSKITYIGDLRCSTEHLQSGTLIENDAPTDNHGKGEKFSPTDFVQLLWQNVHLQPLRF